MKKPVSTFWEVNIPIILMKYLVVSNGKHLGMSLMHDNERAYSCRALDILGLISRTTM